MPLSYSPLTEGIQSAAATSLTGRFEAASFSGAGVSVFAESLLGVVSPAHTAVTTGSSTSYNTVTR